MKTVLPYVVAAVLGLSYTQALAQSQAEGQQACGNDALSLCSDAIPDAGRVAACLHKKYSQVSAPCRRYMASYGKTHKKKAHTARQHHHHKHHHSSG